MSEWAVTCFTLATLFTLSTPHRLASQPVHYTLQLYGGTAWSLPSPLKIHQAGEPDLDFTAHWATRPFAAAPYYAYRLGRWRGDDGWELEELHHKVYLRNRPPEVQRFEVSHGYNLVSLDRARRRRGAIVRAGVGVVIAHTENTVRGRTVSGGGGLFGRGYHLAGAMAQLGVERRVALTRHLFAAGEGKLTGALARVPIAGGSAFVPNVAVHGLVGVGYER